MSINSANHPYSNPISPPLQSDDIEMDIGKTSTPNLSSNLSITPDEKNDPTNKDEKAKKEYRKEWIVLAITTSGIALAVIGIIASSFLIASVFTGLSLLTITMPVAIVGIAFVGCGLTLTFHKKIANVFDSSLNKLIQHFKTKEM